MTNGTQWTVETLREHLLAMIAANDLRYEQRFTASQQAIQLGFSAQKSAVDAALAAADRAVIKAETSAEKRFEAVNEFRSTLADQQRNLIPRSEVDVVVVAISEKIADLQKRVDAQQSERRGVQGGWGYAIGVIGFVAMLMGLALTMWAKLK